MGTSLIKIENEPGLVKDSVSKAIINTDDNSYRAYLRQRSRLKLDKQKMNEYEGQIRDLIDEVMFLKDSVKQLLENMNKK